MTFDEACRYIDQIPRFTKKTRLENTENLLLRLNHPEDCFRVIHVAGTNGKGSVCAYLDRILREEGLRTGLFTSPHLVDVRERFRICGQMISEEQFTEAFEEVLGCVRRMQADGLMHPAYFEFLFAMGMLIFRQQKIDVCVMETGLGGRLDATSCVRHPDLSVITSISFDHMAYLGDTLGKIAYEKAGIIKKGVPVVADGFPREQFDVREALDVIRRRAQEQEAPLTIVSEKPANVSYMPDGIEFTLNNRYYGHAHVRLPFFADYQIENCLGALQAAALFGEKEGCFHPETAVKAVSMTRWPGRMEMVESGVIVDGAHNEDGIAQFMRTVRRIAKRQNVSLLFTAVADKDYQTMIRELCADGLFSAVVTTEIAGPRVAPADRLAEIFRVCADCPVEAVSDIREAYRRAVAGKKDGLLFCAGSLYLAGAIEKIVRGEV